MGLGYSQIPEGQSLAADDEAAMIAALLDALSISKVDIVAGDSGDGWRDGSRFSRSRAEGEAQRGVVSVDGKVLQIVAQGGGLGGDVAAQLLPGDRAVGVDLAGLD